MIRHSRAAVATLATLGLLASCATVSPPADAPGLDGTAWVLAALPGRALLPGSAVTLRFEGGRASGTDGCNRYATPYATSGATLKVEGGGIATQMACAAEVMQQATAFRASLSGAGGYRITAGELELLGPGDAVLARFAPQPQDLAGTSWQVTGYNNGRQAVVSVLRDTRMTLSFTADGRAAGSAGCNGYTAPFTLAGAGLRFGPAAATRRMCIGPEGVMEQERQYLLALETVATARQEGDRLELRTAEGALAVTLVRAAAQ